jgi:hypothetical protein
MTPPHPLDRPVWNALASRQMRFAAGNTRARRFDRDFGLLPRRRMPAECLAAGRLVLSGYGGPGGGRPQQIAGSQEPT